MLGMPFNRTSVQVLRPHYAHAVLVKDSQRQTSKAQAYLRLKQQRL